MKNINGKIMAFLSAVALLTIAPGCMTTPGGHNVVNPAITQSVADDAAFLTAQNFKAKYPEELQITLESLDGFVALGGGTVDELKAALSHLPVGFLQGTNGSVLIDATAPIVSQGGQELVRLDKSEITQYYVLPIATGLRNGLRRALTPAPAGQ